MRKLFVLVPSLIVAAVAALACKPAVEHQSGKGRRPLTQAQPDLEIPLRVVITTQSKSGDGDAKIDDVTDDRRKPPTTDASAGGTREEAPRTGAAAQSTLSDWECAPKTTNGAIVTDSDTKAAMSSCAKFEICCESACTGAKYDGPVDNPISIIPPGAEPDGFPKLDAGEYYCACDCKPAEAIIKSG